MYLWLLAAPAAWLDESNDSMLMHETEVVNIVSIVSRLYRSTLQVGHYK